MHLLLQHLESYRSCVRQLGVLRQLPHRGEAGVDLGVRKRGDLPAERLAEGVLESVTWCPACLCQGPLHHARGEALRRAPARVQVR